MSIDSIPSWRIRGVVTERRELKTKDGKRTWAFAIKLMAMGGMFECQTLDGKLWESIGDGTEVVATGRFEQFSGHLKLVLTDAKSIPLAAGRTA